MIASGELLVPEKKLLVSTPNYYLTAPYGCRLCHRTNVKYVPTSKKVDESLSRELSVIYYCLKKKVVIFFILTSTNIGINILIPTL